MKDFRPPMDIENIRPIDSTVMCYICKLKVFYLELIININQKNKTYIVL